MDERSQDVVGKLARRSEIASTSCFIGQRRELACVGYCERQDDCLLWRWRQESNLRSRVAGKGVAVYNVTDSHLVPISK